MLKIRRSVFETNSSSMHSICIVKSNTDWKENLPSELFFQHGEYGWEEHVYHDVQNKANYLYQAICDLYSEKEKKNMLNQITLILMNYGVMVSFEEEKKDKYGLTYGNIDHPYDLRPFIESVCRTEKKLLRYLFSDKSFIMTGNDNEGHNVEIYVDYKHEEYYKGN